MNKHVCTREKGKKKKKKVESVEEEEAGAHGGGRTSREVSLSNQILAGGWFDVCNITFSDFFFFSYVSGSSWGAEALCMDPHPWKSNENRLLGQSYRISKQHRTFSNRKPFYLLTSYHAVIIFYSDQESICGMHASLDQELIRMKTEWGGGGSHQVDAEMAAGKGVNALSQLHFCSITINIFTLSGYLRSLTYAWGIHRKTMHVCNPAQFYPIDNVFVPLLDVKTCETWAAFIVQQPQETTDV